MTGPLLLIVFILRSVPIALRKTKIVYNFGHSECNRVIIIMILYMFQRGQMLVSMSWKMSWCRVPMPPWTPVPGPRSSSQQLFIPGPCGGMRVRQDHRNTGMLLAVFRVYFIIRTPRWSLELQIRGSIKDSSKIIFVAPALGIAWYRDLVILIPQQTHMLWPLLELSQWDGSDDGSQNMFVWRSMANYHQIIFVTTIYLEHWIIMLQFRIKY